ncbi:MAG: formylmethanofuran dehydrogenase subunit B [Planctomycetia bacterium]|nr:formylmethanofuran dehydrogenase subunit B [Planctomycetia bacterium]
MAKQVFDDIACTVCGCVCDDLRVAVDDGRIAVVEPRCRLAEAWFLKQNVATSPSAAELAGKPVELSVGIAEAANILRQARMPLIYGLARSSTPGQRAAVHLADRLGAVIDTNASTCHGPSIVALQAVGESTSTLGEVRNRADLVIYWGSNPASSHPRHMERYAVEPRGQFVPGGRKDRTLVVVDSRATETARVADLFVQVRQGSDFEVLWVLRALVQGLKLNVAEVGGVPIGVLEDLAARMKGCRTGVVFFGRGLSLGPVGHADVEALLRLTTELNAYTRFYARRMRIYGDVAGADSVLTWQTGYPFSVNLARGYPRYSPGEYSAEACLSRGEVDACVLVGGEGIRTLSDRARAALERIPTIVLDYASAERLMQPTVRFTTAVYGIHRSGTAYRMDEVPIPLRGFMPSPLPSDDEVLDGIRAAL